jgi:hypothetical protein
MANSSNRRFSSPPKYGKPVRAFGDGSWKVLYDIKGTVERLDERTENIKTDIAGIKSDVAATKNSISGIPSQALFLSGIFGIITVVALLTGAYWIAISSKFDTLGSRIDGLKTIQSQTSQRPHH